MPSKIPGAQAVRFICNSAYQDSYFDALREPNHRVILVLGGRQAGKTFVGAAGIPYFLYTRKSNIVSNLGWVLSPTYDQSKVAMKAFEEVCGWYKYGGCILKKNKADHSYDLAPAKGHTQPFRLEFKTAMEPDYLRGGVVDFLWMDEGAFCEEGLWDVIQPCVLRSEGPIWITTTPNGLNWIYNKIYMPSFTDNTIQVIRGKTSDNKALSKIRVAEMSLRYSDVMRRQEMEAEFVRSEGMVYHMFDKTKHVIPPCYDPAGPVDGKFDGEIVVGIDHGFKDPFVYLWALKKNHCFTIVEEYYMPGKTTESHARTISGHKLESLTCRRWADPAGAQSRADLESYGIPTFSAQNDQKMGIDAVAAALESGRLKIASNCTNLIREIQSYHYKNVGLITSSGKTEVPAPGNDHALDALRYIIYSEKSYVPLASENPWYEPEGKSYNIHEGTGTYKIRYDKDGNIANKDFTPWENPWKGPDGQDPNPNVAPDRLH